MTLVRRGYRTPEEARAFLAADESHPPSALRRDGAGRRAGPGGDRSRPADHRPRRLRRRRRLRDGADGLDPARAGCRVRLVHPQPDRGRLRALSEENVRRLAERGHRAAAHGRLRHHLGGGGGAGAGAGDGGGGHRPPPAGGGAARLPDPAPGGQRVPVRVAVRDRGGLEAASLGGSWAGSERVRRAARATSTWSPWRRWPTWCRWSARTGRWCGGAWRRSGARSGPGSRALLEASKCDPERLDESDLAFRLAPRINAAGRLYRADAGVELLPDRGRASGPRRSPRS